MSWFNRTTVGRVISRLGSDVEDVRIGVPRRRRPGLRLAPHRRDDLIEVLRAEIGHANNAGAHGPGNIGSRHCRSHWRIVHGKRDQRQAAIDLSLGVDAVAQARRVSGRAKTVELP